MARSYTVDELALRILMESGSAQAAERKLDALRRQVAIMCGACCPSCGAGHLDIEDNGERGSDASYRCTRCGEGWDAVQG